jgi:hypothetical protein
MDKTEAIKVLDIKINDLKRMPYTTFDDWRQRKHIETYEIKSQTGQFYKIEAQAVFDEMGDAKGNIRVLATIDNSQVMSFTKSIPMLRQFTIAPSNMILPDN